MYKLMIVEDNNIQIETIRYIIDWKKYQVSEIYVARDGLDGLDMFRHVRPDIIITDIVMPIMDGISMMNEIHKEDTSVKFIFISSHNDFHYLKTALDSGVVSYILKPIEQTELEDALKKLLNQIETTKKLDNIKQYENEQLSMYRKNFLYRLLYAKKTDAESLRNNLNNLKFNDFKNYIVVKIKISHNNSSGADFFEAYSMARQSFFEQLEGTIIMESENCFLAVFANSLYDTDTFLQTILSISEDFSSDADVKLGLKAFVGISKISETLMDIHLMINQASVALDNTFAMCYNNINIYDDDADIPFVDNVDYNIINIKGSIEEYIHSGSSEQMQMLLNTYCPRQIHYSKHYVQMLCMMILCSIQLIITERNIELLSIFKDYAKIWDDIEKITTIDDLKNWIAKTIDYAAKNFRENELNRHEQLVNSIKSYINANYDSISNIEQITSSIYISESYARRIFKSLTGKTIFEYLQIVRMEKAKQLLENPKYRIYEIADMVGYKSKPYFVETFRKYTGVSPKDYRSRK